MAAASPFGPGADDDRVAAPEVSQRLAGDWRLRRTARTGAPIIQTVERIADECHTFVHRDHCRRLSTQTTTVSTSASG